MQTIVNVMPGSPADKEHLADGDVIESIGDQSTRELSLAVIRLMLEGKAGQHRYHLAGSSPQSRPGQAHPDSHHAISAPALSEQQYENSSILYLKPGALTNGPRRRDCRQDQGRPQDRKVLLDLRDASDGEASEGIAAGQFLHQSGHPGHA